LGVDYSREKFVTVLQSLAASTRPLQQRLESAFLTFSPIVVERDIPAGELRKEYQEIHDIMTADKSDAEAGYMPTTLSRLSDEEAEALVDKIVTFAIDLIQER
jgi:hypothetical protein